MDTFTLQCHKCHEETDCIVIDGKATCMDCEESSEEHYDHQSERDRQNSCSEVVQDDWQGVRWK